MILTPILLLNMLIASMGNTYQRVISISEKERIRQVNIVQRCFYLVTNI